MTTLIACAASDALGYPGYFRATYVRGRIDLASQLSNVVAGVTEKMRDSALAVPVNDPTPLPGDRAAVLDLRVSDGSVGVNNTVAQLARELDVSPLWGIIPDILAAVNLVSIERIDASRAYDDTDRDAARKKANDEANTNDPLGKLEHVLLVVAIVVAVIIVGVIAYKAVRAVRG